MQVADVKRTLGSVHRINQAGNKVVGDGKESFMVHKTTGAVTPIHVEQGQYVFHLWVQKGPTADNKKGNMFAALADDKVEEGTGFTRRD